MAEERVQRRFAAILAADVVGYSRLMHEDEEGKNAIKWTRLSCHGFRNNEVRLELHQMKAVTPAQKAATLKSALIRTPATHKLP